MFGTHAPSTEIPANPRTACGALAALPRPAALLFDLDGTLVDSVEDIHVAVNALLAELGLATRTRDEVATWVGNGARMLVERAIAGRFEGFRGLDDEPSRHAFADRAMPRFRAIYEKVCVDHTKPLAGATESLEAARAAGIAVAIVTNKPLAPTERIVDALGWRALVGAVIGGDSLPVRKPDPAPLHEALKRLEALKSLEAPRLLGRGHAAADAWMIGDSANDVGAARAARMPCVVVRGGYNHGRTVESLDPAPDAILDSLRDLARHLGDR